MAQAAPDITTPSASAKAEDLIIVTGTRVGQKVADQPVQAISGTTLNNLGYTNIGEALTSLPIFGTPANSTIGAQSSFGAGQTFINLYNLGSQRTLTLVNGNRFVSAASSSFFGASVGSPVDLGQIAPSLVDRIDVVSVGGAPIYGTDAIAGTVNIVLKHDYQGVELTSSDGISNRGDARDYNFSLLVGHNFAEGRGNITANIYYDHQDGLSTASRYLTGGNSPFYGYSNSNTPYSQAVYQGGDHWDSVPNTGIPLTGDNIPFYFGPTGAGVTNASGQTLYFNKQGKLTPFINGIVTGDGYDEAGGSGLATSNYGNLLTTSNRLQGTLLWHFDVSDHLRVHGELWGGRNTATNVEDQPYYSTNFFGAAGTYNGNLVLNTNNPYLSAGDRATLQAAIGTPGTDGTFYLARGNTDLYSGAFTSTSYLFRAIGGMDGDFQIGNHAFRWDATLNYGRSTTISTAPQLVFQNLTNALNATTDGSGNITCAGGYTSAAIATQSNTCAPLDIFGTGNESQAALNYVTAIARTRQLNTQLDFVADLKGDVINLPAGKVKMALGVEVRRESQNFDPGAFFRGQDVGGTYVQYGNSIPVTPVAGAIHTHELFGELTVPLVAPDMNVPLINSVELHGAARYTDNSLVGGNWSYTAGGNYAPFGGFTFRGNYTRSFRAPSVTEAFAPNGSTFEYGSDPCDKSNVGGGPNPAIRAANCAAAGIDTSTFVSNFDNFTIEGTSAGNSHLQNEIADSWTAGIQANPHFVPGFQLTADFIAIDIKNEITLPGVTAELDACYDSSNFPNNPYCSTVTRDSTGQIINFTDNFANISIERFRALQAGTNYTLPLKRIGLPASAGALNISATYLHTYRHYTKISGQDQQFVLGNITNPVDAVNANFDWQTKTFDWLMTVNYYGPTLVDPNVAIDTYQYPRVSPYWMADTSVGIKVNEKMDLRLTVKNVFNLGVPQPGVFVGGTNKYFDAVLGRAFRLTAKVRL